MSKEKKPSGLPKGIRQLPSGKYEARAQVNKISINLYGHDLAALIQEFEDEKEKARTGSAQLLELSYLTRQGELKNEIKKEKHG